MQLVTTILHTDREAQAVVHMAWDTVIDQALQDLGQEEFVGTILTVLKHKRSALEDDTSFRLKRTSDHRDALLSRVEFLERQLREAFKE